MKNRELDALVAEKVMGLEIRKSAAQNLIYWDDVGGPEKQGSIEFVPNYSTNISDAWLVVEKLSMRGIYLRLSNIRGRGKWRCATEMGITDFVESAPHAICLAALRAVGIKI